jgi:hypothetical protein
MILQIGGMDALDALFARGWPQRKVNFFKVNSTCELYSPYPIAKPVGCPIVLQNNVSRIFDSSNVKFQTCRKNKVSTGHSVSREGSRHVDTMAHLARGLYTSNRYLARATTVDL